MFGFLIVLIVIAAILLIVIVLAQNPKGGGLAQGFSGGNQMLGVQGTNKFLTNTTWILVGFIAFASVISASFYGSSSENYSNLPYFTFACAIGITEKEIDGFCEKFTKIIDEYIKGKENKNK